MRPLASTFLCLALAAGCSTAPDHDGSGSQQLVYLQHVSSEDLVSTLHQLGLPETLEVAVDPGTNSVLLQGDIESIQQALELIARLDKPAR